MKNLDYLMDHILYQGIQDHFKYILKKQWQKNVNPSIRIYTNKIENRIMFIIKKGHYLELLTTEKMKLLRSTKSKIYKRKKWWKGPYLEITDIVLIHCIVVNNSHLQNSRVVYICSSYIFRSIIRYFTLKFYFFENISSRILVYLIMVYWSKF